MCTRALLVAGGLLLPPENFFGQPHFLARPRGLGPVVRRPSCVALSPPSPCTPAPWPSKGAPWAGPLSSVSVAAVFGFSLASAGQGGLFGGEREWALFVVRSAQLPRGRG